MDRGLAPEFEARCRERLGNMVATEIGGEVDRAEDQTRTSPYRAIVRASAMPAAVSINATTGQIAATWMMLSRLAVLGGMIATKGDCAATARSAV